MFVNLIFDFLKGNKKLWQAWWLTWVLPRICMTVIVTLLLQSPSNNVLIYLLVALFFDWTFTVFGAIASWQCSNNSESRGWSSIARGLILVGPFLGFAQLSGSSSDFTSNTLLNFSMICALIMLVIWFISNPNKPNFFNKKLLMPIAILISYTLFFTGEVFWGYTNLLIKTMTAEFSITNKKLPIMLDSETEFTKVYLSHRTINYQYTLTNIDNTSKESFIEKMKPQLINRACGSEQTHTVLTHGFDFSYNYNDQKGTPFANISVKNADCILK